MPTHTHRHHAARLFHWGVVGASLPDLDVVQHECGWHNGGLPSLELFRNRRSSKLGLPLLRLLNLRYRVKKKAHSFVALNLVRPNPFLRQEQSPINIDPAESVVDIILLERHRLHYLPLPTPTPTPQTREATIFRTKRETPSGSSSGGSWAYNGHTVQMNWPPGDYITGGPLQDNQYALVQLQFHAPSENNYACRFLIIVPKAFSVLTRLIGTAVSYPLEVQLVHQAPDGTYAVVAVMFAANDSVQSSFLTTLATSLPVEEGKTFAIAML